MKGGFLVEFVVYQMSRYLTNKAIKIKALSKTRESDIATESAMRGESIWILSVPKGILHEILLAFISNGIERVKEMLVLRLTDSVYSRSRAGIILLPWFC